jgi:hypothetical protein
MTFTRLSPVKYPIALQGQQQRRGALRHSCKSGWAHIGSDERWFSFVECGRARRSVILIEGALTALPSRCEAGPKRVVAIEWLKRQIADHGTGAGN